MPVTRNTPDPAKFNAAAVLPYQLRLEDFRLAMQDVYDFFHDVNTGLVAKGLERLDDMLRPAIMYRDQRSSTRSAASRGSALRPISK
jgi:hypothetical protein